MCKWLFKILITILLLSISVEIAIPAFTGGNPVCIAIDGDESEEKKSDEKTETEEGKDKISGNNDFLMPLNLTDKPFYIDIFFSTTAYKSLPDNPPDLV